jgi:glutathione synthase/RimK-type ligase-like ATP-grasp enzyme
MNKGSQGINVFKCINRTQILKALNRIFDRSSPHYDYLAISQKFIEISEEYRVIAWRGEVLLTYKKDNDKADFEGNLSPLHWKNARAIQIKDPKINAAMQEFLAPIFETLPIDFFGADVAIDPKNKKFLLEINGSPGVSKFVKDNSLSPIIQMYEKIFQDLIDSKENTK